MAKSKDVVQFGETDLMTLNFNELMELGVIDIAEIDDVVKVDKKDLVGKPMILVDWAIKMGELGEYAVIKVKTQDGTAVFADGGAGICNSLEEYRLTMEKRSIPFSPLYFHYGLRASDYIAEIPNADGEVQKIAATTYYFDNRRRP